MGDWADNGRVGLWGTGLRTQGPVQYTGPRKWRGGPRGAGVWMKVEMGRGGTGLRMEVWRGGAAKGGVGRGALTVYFYPGFTN